jgi:hypothetical protein
MGEKNMRHPTGEGMTARGSSKWKKKTPGKNSGRSFSALFPLGMRRRGEDGGSLAPRSLRRKGKRLESECSLEELVRAGVMQK